MQASKVSTDNTEAWTGSWAYGKNNKNNNKNNNNNLYLHYSGRGKRKEEKKQNIENKIMEDL